MKEHEQMDMVTKDPNSLQYIKNPTEKVQWIAVKKKVFAIRYIENPSEELKLYAVKRNGRVLQYIKKYNEEIQKEAVKQNGLVLQLIKEPSEEVKILAIQEDPGAIKYIENPPEKLQLLALENDAFPIFFIENPTIKVIFEYFSQISKNVCKGYLEKKVYARNLKSVLFEEMLNEREESFLNVVPKHQEILKEEKYFTSLLRYIMTFHEDWIEGFINKLKPLTKTQENIWKQERLKAIL